MCIKVMLANDTVQDIIWQRCQEFPKILLIMLLSILFMLALFSMTMLRIAGNLGVYKVMTALLEYFTTR